MGEVAACTAIDAAVARANQLPTYGSVEVRELIESRSGHDRGMHPLHLPLLADTDPPADGPRAPRPEMAAVRPGQRAD